MNKLIERSSLGLGELLELGSRRHPEMVGPQLWFHPGRKSKRRSERIEGGPDLINMHAGEEEIVAAGGEEIVAAGEEEMKKES